MALRTFEDIARRVAQRIEKTLIAARVDEARAHRLTRTIAKGLHRTVVEAGTLCGLGLAAQAAMPDESTDIIEHTLRMRRLALDGFEPFDTVPQGEAPKGYIFRAEEVERTIVELEQIEIQLEVAELELARQARATEAAQDIQQHYESALPGILN